MRPDANIQGMEMNYEIVQVLRLTGMWLAEAGFDVGTLIEIERLRGRLIISIDKQAMADLEKAVRDSAPDLGKG